METSSRWSNTMQNNADLVGTWSVTLSDKVYKIEFEHGTTTGKRVIRVDDKEVFRKDWMFKLVGVEQFKVGSTKCAIVINATDGFTYEYALQVNGKDLEKFSQRQSRIMCTWLCNVDGMQYRIVLEKDTLDIWVNGERVPMTGEFVEGGTETHFTVGPGIPAFIKTVSSGKRRSGIVHSLFINNSEIPLTQE